MIKPTWESLLQLGHSYQSPVAEVLSPWLGRRAGGVGVGWGGGGAWRGDTTALLWGLLSLLLPQKSNALTVTALEEQMSFSFYAGVWWESGHVTESKPIL